MIMFKVALPYFLSLCLSLITSQVLAQDMSAWSDKTVCRLAKSGSDQEHIDEAVSRGIDCEFPSVKLDPSSNSEKPINPLDALTIPDDWALLANKAVFDFERFNVKGWGFDYSPRHRALANNCLEIMSDFHKNNLYLAKNQDRLEKMSSVSEDKEQYFEPTVDTCLDYYPQLAGAKGRTPKDIEKLLLIWSKTDAFVFQTPSQEKKLSLKYNVISALTVMASYYAVYYDEFEYSPEDRKLVDDYFSKKLLEVKTKDRMRTGAKRCNPRTQASFGNKIDADGCGSLVWKTAVGQLFLGLRLNNAEVFKKGIENTQWQLNFFNEDGIFLPWASKGASAMQYTGDLTAFLGLLTEVYDTIDYDFMEHKIPNGLTIKQVMDKQEAIHYDHMLLYKYASQRKQAYKGASMKQFASWTAKEALHKSGTSLYIMAREMARYVDTYRPDLAHLRDVTYKSMDKNGRFVQVHSNFHAIEPYKIYLANTSVADICKTVKCNTFLLKKFDALSGQAE
jgi:hypothetical protein